MTENDTVRRVILGTAGHIDHGKTTLVERLTGARTDRLKEERERGMTIDVGYAEFQLADGTEVGLLDVPGHERLVRTMVAAATAVDLVLLVVAADDGPMPQTREHVEILDLLGVTRLIVAITKTDLSDEETFELVLEETRELLEPTGMKGAPMLPVSSETGEGIEALREAIQAAIPPRREDESSAWSFRMPVLRAFVAQGRGAVLTGIPVAGVVRVKDAIEVMPGHWGGRVRSIQVHKRPADEARAHRRTALALSDIEAGKIHRGMTVTSKGALDAVRRVAVSLRLLESGRKLEHRDRVRLHVGAVQVVARVHVLGDAAIRPGARAIVEFEAFEDLAVAPGDRFVIREENASATLGGGVVVDLLDRHLPRRRAGIVARLEERSHHLDDPKVLVLAVLQGRGENGARLKKVAARSGLRPEVLDGVMDALVAEGVARRLGHAGDLWIEEDAFQRVLTRIETGAKRAHEKDPALAQVPVSTVRTAAGRVEGPILDAALDHLVEAGRLLRDGAGGIRLASHKASISEHDQRDMARVRDLLARAGGQPPAVEDLEADLGLPRPRVLRVLRLLQNRGEVLQAEDYFFEGAWVAEAKRRLKAHAEAHGGFSPGDARSLLDSTRKWVIPLLEALDRTGFSRRRGDKRVVLQ